jgi:hypothetical protein
MTDAKPPASPAKANPIRRRLPATPGPTAFARSKIFLRCSTLCGSPGPRSSSGISRSASWLPSCPSASASSAASSSTESTASACTALPQHFWWLVGAEMALAVLTGILSRAVDYFDNLLADRYTHHVSVEVMRKAASLDVTVYEDPVFYDRLERARVQATDRLAMIQQMGRLISRPSPPSPSRPCSSATRRFCCCCSWPASFPRFSAKATSLSSPTPRTFRQTPVAPPDGLSAPGGRQQRGGQGTQALQPQRLLTGRFTGLSQEFTKRMSRSTAASFLGRAAGHPRPARLLRRLRFSIYRTIQGRYSIGDLTLITTAIMQAMAISSRPSQPHPAWPTRRSSSPTCSRSLR